MKRQSQKSTPALMNSTSMFFPEDGAPTSTPPRVTSNSSQDPLGPAFHIPESSTSCRSELKHLNPNCRALQHLPVHSSPTPATQGTQGTP